MNPTIAAQELARRFNEDEAVWRCYEPKRAARQLPSARPSAAEDILDGLDWQAAERECRMVRAVGFFQP
ncbi:hypothetical protein LBMAG56_04080 [Verrucomicrobiota bacterium]|nr:hypothetical protein LBMAG56_04080 [Verrucomicrobiota bacterium]